MLKTDKDMGNAFIACISTALLLPTILVAQDNCYCSSEAQAEAAESNWHITESPAKFYPSLQQVTRRGDGTDALCLGTQHCAWLKGPYSITPLIPELYSTQRTLLWKAVRSVVYLFHCMEMVKGTCFTVFSLDIPLYFFQA